MRKTVQLLLLGLGISTSMALAQEPRQHEEGNFTSRIVIRDLLGRGFLGVQLTPLTPELRTHFGVPEDTGVMVSRVEEGGPAEAAGIHVGDILATVDGERIDSPRQIARAVRKKDDGELVNLELYRDGGLQSVTVTVSERDRPVIDLADGYQWIPDMEELPDHDVIFRAPGIRLNEESMEAFEEAMRDLEEHFDSPEWKEKVERLNELDFSAVEKRMEEVEKRLEELEKELEKNEKGKEF